MSGRLFSFQNVLNSLVFTRPSLHRGSRTVKFVIGFFVSPRTQRERNVVRSINQSINQSFILTRYVKELKNSFKIRTCINKIYNNYCYIILFNFKNNSVNYTYKKLGNKNIKYKKLKPTKKPHTENMTSKTLILVLKTVKSYNRAL